MCSTDARSVGAGQLGNHRLVQDQFTTEQARWGLLFGLFLWFRYRRGHGSLSASEQFFVNAPQLAHFLPLGPGRTTEDEKRRGQEHRDQHHDQGGN